MAQRMSYADAKQIIEGLGKTVKVSASSREEFKATECRYYLEMQGEVQCRFTTGFEVVQYAKYVKANKIKSVSQLLEADVAAWWKKTSAENTREFFKQKALEKKAGEQND